MGLCTFGNLSGDKVALIDQHGTQITYSELTSHANFLANEIPDNALVVVNASNTINFVIIYLSALQNKFGLVILPEKTKKQDALGIVQKFKAHSFIEYGMDRFSEFKKDFYLHTYFDSESIDSEIKLLLSTSGSISKPKFVKLSLDNIQSNSNSIIQALSLKNSDVAISTLPLNYSYGLSILNTHLLVKGKVVLTNKSFLDKEFWNLVNEFNVTNFGGVPKQFEILLRVAERLKLAGSLRFITQAGGKLQISTQKQVKNILGSKVKFFAMYGQTEATARISILQDRDWESKCGSVGQPICGVEVVIEPNSGIEIGGNEILNSSTSGNAIGEIIVKGKNVFLGYANDFADLKESNSRPNRLSTGDVGYRDNDGYLYVLGRNSREVKITGRRLNLDFIETVCKENFKIHAIVSKNDAIFVFAPYRQPKLIDFLSEDTGITKSQINVVELNEVPLLISGKVDFTELEKMC